MTLSDTTLLIPLYRSTRFLENVVRNIDAHIAHGGPVICSDEHLLDEAAAGLAARYAGNDLVRILQSNAGGNWVSNCNGLIEACQTPYFRILPHDDETSAASTGVLASVLRDRPEVIVSHGWVRAETTEGQRLPNRDTPRQPPEPMAAARFSTGLFWQGLYNGAFKSVIRRNVVEGAPLIIRPTPTLQHSERAWLFGLSLLGAFAFSEEAFMLKRYWQGSTSDAWCDTGQLYIDTADIMTTYVDDLISNPAVQNAYRFNLYLNAVRRADWIDGLNTTRPRFDPYFCHCR